MVNKRRRIISICLCFSLILLNGISANAVDVHENREDVLLIQEVEHGEFSVTEGHQRFVDSSNSFAVYRIPSRGDSFYTFPAGNVSFRFADAIRGNPK